MKFFQCFVHACVSSGYTLMGCCFPVTDGPQIVPDGCYEGREILTLIHQGDGYGKLGLLHWVVINVISVIPCK